MNWKALARKLTRNRDYVISIFFPIALLLMNIWRNKQPAYNDGVEDAYLTKAVRLSVSFIQVVGSPNPFTRSRTLLI
jgi:hypothetical protein